MSEFVASPVVVDQPKMPTAVRFGVLSGLVGTVVMFVMYFAGMFGNDAGQWISYVLTAVFIFLTHKTYKQINGGFMGYGQGLSLGTMMALVSGLIGTVAFLILITMVDPSLTEKMVTLQQQKMEAKGNMTDEQIEGAMEMAKKFMTPTSMFIFGVLGSVVIGFIGSLIISAFTKHTRPEFE